MISINNELKAYNADIANRPQVIAANKIDAIFTDDDPVQRLKDEFEPQGVKVFPISGVTGQGIKELLYYVSNELQHLEQDTIVFEQEYFPEEEIPMNDLPYTVEKEDDMYVVEGPKIEKMLGYTNLDSERGFAFFQKFLKDSGILEQLEEAGIQEGDTVRMYGLQFDYYKDPIFQIGKNSMTPEVTKAIQEALDARELIKISVLKNCADDPRALAEVIAERTRSQVVQVIGKKIVLYKEGKDKHKKIELPK